SFLEKPALTARCSSGCYYRAGYHTRRRLGFHRVLFGSEDWASANISATPNLGFLAAELYFARSTPADATSYLVVPIVGSVPCTLDCGAAISGPSDNGCLLVHQQLCRGGHWRRSDTLLTAWTSPLR